eukprot:2028501-Rhodomonas_salina.2
MRELHTKLKWLRTSAVHARYNFRFRAPLPLPTSALSRSTTSALALTSAANFRSSAAKLSLQIPAVTPVTAHPISVPAIAQERRRRQSCRRRTIQQASTGQRVGQ